MTLIEKQLYNYLVSNRTYWIKHKDDIVSLKITNLSDVISYEIEYYYDYKSHSYISTLYYHLLKDFNNRTIKQKLNHLKNTKI